MLFLYAAVNNASREAVRYASAWGLNDDPTNPIEKFNDCRGIRDTARSSAFFANLPDDAIVISKDDGLTSTNPPTAINPVPNYCGGKDQANILISTGDRVTVQVTIHYKPMVNLIPIPERDFVSISSRTVLGILDLGTGSGSVSNPGANTAVPTKTKTPTIGPSPTATGTATVTATATATFSGSVDTLTPQVSPTITLLPNQTGTATATATGTATTTATATMTFTPTPTSTPKPGCDSILASKLRYNIDAAKSMSMTITNPHDTLAVASVRVVWNYPTGGQKGQTTIPLTLQTISLGGNFWTGTNVSSDFTYPVPVSANVTIPGNNRTSTIIFGFDTKYVNLNGTEAIYITLLTPGCENVTITNLP